MKSMVKSFLGFAVLILLASLVYAEENPAKELVIKCSAELETFCKDVTPGKGRVLACLYAYSDKLSEPCAEVVQDTYDDLKLISAASSHLQNECGKDLDKFCKDVAPGQGRLLNCLEKNESHLSQKCQRALKEVGLKD
jgi:hypothetical protein